MFIDHQFSESNMLIEPEKLKFNDILDSLKGFNVHKDEIKSKFWKVKIQSFIKERNLT